jgi:hypothetical protein
VDGLFTVILGDSTALNLPFDETYWLGIQVNADPELVPRIQLAAAPYALRAAVADTASDDDWVIAGSDVYRLSGNVGIGTDNPGEMLDIAGTAQVGGFRMPTAASSGHVLTSDDDGTGTWQAQPALRTHVGEWFYVEPDNTYQITHGLGTTNVLFTLLFNTIPTDTHAQLTMPMELKANPDANELAMYGLRIDDGDRVSLRTGNQRVASTMDFSTGEPVENNSGYYRVIVVALD